MFRGRTSGSIGGRALSDMPIRTRPAAPNPVRGRPARAPLILRGLLVPALLAAPGALVAQEATAADSAAGTTALVPAALEGRVLSASTGEPLEGAVVNLVGSGFGAITDSTGAFEVPRTRAGPDTVQVRYIGYTPSEAPIDLRPEVTTHAVFLLSPTVLRLVDIRVEIPRGDPDREAFEGRRRLGFGVFLDREEIESRNAEHASDLFRRINGVDVREGDHGEARVFLYRMGQICEPDFYIDGARTEGLAIDDLRPSDIEAIEIYRRGSEAPPRFNVGNCGAVLLWLRAGP